MMMMRKIKKKFESEKYEIRNGEKKRMLLLLLLVKKKYCRITETHVFFFVFFL
jgi:hypothetical protein